MTCPECGEKTVVVNSKAYEDYIWRRRECVCCKLRFNTVEIDEDLYERLVKPRDKN